MVSPATSDKLFSIDQFQFNQPNNQKAEEKEESKEATESNFQIDNNRTQSEKTEDSVFVFKAENEKLRKENKELKKENKSLKERIVNLEERQEKNDKEMLMITERFNKLLLEMLELNQRTFLLENKSNSKEEENRELKKEVKELKETHAKEIEDIKKKNNTENLSSSKSKSCFMEFLYTVFCCKCCEKENTQTQTTTGVKV